MSKQEPFNHSSLKKYQWDLSSVQIPGKITLVLRSGNTFTSWLIMANDSTVMEKEIISTDRKVFGGV